MIIFHFIIIWTNQIAMRIRRNGITTVGEAYFNKWQRQLVFINKSEREKLLEESLKPLHTFPVSESIP
jgi:hypothetical protein